MRTETLDVVVTLICSSLNLKVFHLSYTCSDLQKGNKSSGLYLILFCLLWVVTNINHLGSLWRHWEKRLLLLLLRLYLQFPAARRDRTDPLPSSQLTYWKNGSGDWGPGDVPGFNWMIPWWHNNVTCNIRQSQCFTWPTWCRAELYDELNPDVHQTHLSPGHVKRNINQLLKSTVVQVISRQTDEKIRFAVLLTRSLPVCCVAGDGRRLQRSRRSSAGRRDRPRLLLPLHQ